MERKIEKAFRKGLREVRVCDVAEVRNGLAEILGVGTKQSLARYSAGKANLDVEKAARIEELFKKYGVRDCWGL